MMKDKSSVNIVVPVYNVADLLPRCIDSLLAQTYRDVRIVLVDDGSTDDCPAICDRYAEQDPRVISLHRTNGGLSAARNTGIDHVFSIEEPSRGRYISFVDSDDWVEPGYVESMLETLEASGADAAQCGHFVSYAPDNEDDKDPAHTRTTLDRAQAVESLCRNGLWDVTAWNKLYRLDLFKQIRYPEGLLYEDTATTYLITQECDRVAADMTPQYHYAQRYTSIANGTTWKDSKLNLVLAGDRMAAWVCEHYPDLKTAAAEKRAYVRLSTLSQMVNTGHHDKNLARRLRREVLSVAPTVLCDRRASKRDKLGILALLPGFWCYRAIWSRYYEAKRNRTVAGPTGTPDTTGKEQS
ncbi:MAG: glycosyltransferase family 2 protein [Bifidobacterium pseudocatenulatum]|uniref:glycosyltransferase family 2 protein n=1 Tax=Bifidobacterium pseudocatenulatum TaxID=28026 RepID=UPI00321BFF72